MRIPFHGALSVVNDRSVQQTLQKPNYYRTHYGKCLRIVGVKTLNFDGKPDACATGFSTPLPHESRGCRASEELFDRCLEYELEKRPIQKRHESEMQEERDKMLLEVFDKVLGHRPFDPLISKQFRQLCDRRDLVPISYAIPRERIKTLGDCASASGGFGDVWEGICDGQHVAIKALRVYKTDDKRKVSRVFYKEVTIWKRLSHPNIVPFLGVTDDPAPLSIVLEWMPNGDVRQFVKDHPEADRLQLLLDVCNGLQVLHDHGVVHGDLKSANILINGLGWACLTDFGLSSITSLNCTENSANGPGGSCRWTAPELMYLSKDQPSRPTKQSDIYAFAMVTIEVFTGVIPFQSCHTDPAVMIKVRNKERPPRPAEATKFGLTDDLWDLIRSAWAQEPESRPPVERIVGFLLRAS